MTERQLFSGFSFCFCFVLCHVLCAWGIKNGQLVDSTCYPMQFKIADGYLILQIQANYLKRATLRPQEKRKNQYYYFTTLHFTLSKQLVFSRNGAIMRKVAVFMGAVIGNYLTSKPLPCDLMHTGRCPQSLAVKFPKIAPRHPQSGEIADNVTLCRDFLIFSIFTIYHDSNPIKRNRPARKTMPGGVEGQTHKSHSNTSRFDWHTNLLKIKESHKNQHYIFNVCKSRYKTQFEN